MVQTLEYAHLDPFGVKRCRNQYPESDAGRRRHRGIRRPLCCLGPLLLVTLGVSGAWTSNLTALEPYRPVFIGGALVLMGLAWRRIYHVPAAGACEPGAVCALPQTNRVYKIMFCLVSALVLLTLAFPLIAPFFLLGNPPC